jgi:hypothetical protein
MTTKRAFRLPLSDHACAFQDWSFEELIFSSAETSCNCLACFRVVVLPPAATKARSQRQSFPGYAWSLLGRCARRALESLRLDQANIEDWSEDWRLCSSSSTAI